MLNNYASASADFTSSSSSFFLRFFRNMKARNKKKGSRESETQTDNRPLKADGVDW